MIGAFFDMDRTLLSESSSLLWIRYMREQGQLVRRQLVSLATILLRYKLGLLDIPAMTRKMVADMAGELEAERIAFTQRWFHEQLVDYVAEVGRQRLEEHRRQGHRPVLITASPNYTADQLAEHLRIPGSDVLASRFEVRNGHFTGKIVEPMCYREGKLHWAQHHAAQEGIDLGASYFYTDSIDDLPLLERVAHPVAVNPEKALRKLAERRRWPIIRFY